MGSPDPGSMLCLPTPEIQMSRKQLAQSVIPNQKLAFGGSFSRSKDVNLAEVVSSLKGTHLQSDSSKLKASTE